MSLGLIVSGEDHFLVRGPACSVEMARTLVRRWTFLTPEDLLGLSPPIPSEWKITTKEFREDIAWAIVLPAATEHTPAVAQLVAELRARGILGGD
ncbi:hypothetical protein [Bryobacter aggregatus]|uniref:hypothetical protein n=1 Tax=Bryobacter aggregatus TaxID=360054 RepID=UPI0004E1FCCD|nr:hypothetical protein [Bryobacter aggregatus]